MPRRLGQHFLADRRALERIASALRLEDTTGAGGLVIEIGGGRGALTEVLAARAHRLEVIELDAELAEHLRQRFADQSHVRIIAADVLNLSFENLVAEAGAERAAVAGNLPYYITSPILMRLFAAAPVLSTVVVLVQREVAERITAAPVGREYGVLSVTAQLYSRPELLFRLPPGAFRPPPDVESAAVRLNIEPRAAALGLAGKETAFLDFVRTCFHQKRKTLRNNLKGAFADHQIAAALMENGLAPSSRAESLAIGQLAKIFHLLSGPLVN